ncbi:hypothetical protein [Nocardia farcinica]|nr:hypothetical protein [Nocardia farcinica]
MAAVEVRLRKLRQKGYDTASRTEIADAVRDAATWGDQSEVAGNELGHLALHVSRRWGVELDLDTGQASIAPGTDAQRLAEIEQDRAAAARARKAQDRMVEMVAREDDLDESAKVGIYAAIESWRADPSAEKLDALTRQLKDRKVPQQTRTRLRFVAAYLGTPAAIGDEENADIKTVSAAEELSRHATPLVDPGEEAKPRIDKLLETYQEQLKVGADTSEVREELAREVAVLTVEDQEAARARGKAIRANPAGAYPRMWPDHVDRDELDEHIRVYALLAPKAEQAAGKAGDLDDVTATQLAKQAASHKTAIRKALTDGKGLHDLERDQIKAVLRDVEAGKPTVPEQLFADDRSAAIVDIQRTQRIAYNTHRTQRRDLDEILDTGAVPEPVRQQVREHLDNTTGAVEMAHRGVADAAFKWARRREAVIVSRTAAVIEADGGYACVHHSVMGTGRERVGAVWCESDYRLLFEALALGMTDEEIAAHIDREVGGVRSRALLLVDNATSKKGALPMLRRLAEAPDFDWDTWVREVHTRENLPYWDTAADEALIGHWAAEPPPRIQQLCEQFGVGQDVIARRAIILGLAQTRAEVVDRFGAAPGSGLAVNAVLAKDKLAAAVAVLVVTDTTGEVLYLSLHPTTDEATTSLQDLTTTPLAAIQGRWTIGTRVVGEGSVRPTDTGTWPATTEYIPAPQERPSRWRRLLRPVRQG